MTLTYLVHTPVLVATLDLSVQPQVGSGCFKLLIGYLLAAVKTLIQFLDTLNGFIG